MKEKLKLTGRNNFFIRFLCSFLLVLAIPLCTIILLYGIAENLIRKEILAAGENSLKQFNDVLDSNMTGMLEITAQAINNSSVRSFAVSSEYESNTDYYKKYEIYKMLTDFPRKKYQDLFLYYNNLDTVISAGRASLSSHLYYGSYYNDLTEWENFEKILKPAIYYKPVLFALDSDSDSPVLGMSWKQNVNFIKDEQWDVTVTVTLYPYVLNGILDSAVYNKAGSVMIYDSEKKLLVSKGGNKTPMDLEHYDGRNMIYNDVFDGQKYVMLVKHSEAVDGYYAYAIPEGYFWKRLNILRIISGIGLAFCTLLSAFIAVILSRRFYMPITSVLHAIQSRSDKSYNKSFDNEFDFIHQVLQESFESNRQLKRLANQNENTARDEFVIHAMNGTPDKEEHWEDIFREYGINLKTDIFMAILIYAEEKNNKAIQDTNIWENKKIVDLILKNVMEEVSGEKHQGYVVWLESGIYGLLVNFSDSGCLNYRKEGEEICRKGSLFLKEKMGILCTFALGEAHNGLHGINDSYKEARNSMRYRFLAGKGSMISYEEVKGRSFRYNTVTSVSITGILMSFVKGDGKEAAEAVCELLDSQDISENEAIETIECFKYDVVNSIIKVSLETGGIKSAREKGIIDLLRAETLEEFKQAVISILLKLKEYEENRKEQDNVCIRVKRYIDLNYREQDINVNRLGMELDVSPSYLSHLFKEQFGIGLLDYLYKVRIEEAKRLLRETADSVGDIAAKTGFLSSSALIKVFKKNEGITPGAYRELV